MNRHCKYGWVGGKYKAKWVGVRRGLVGDGEWKDKRVWGVIAM